MKPEQKERLQQAAFNAAKSLQERDKPITTAIERSHAAKWFKVGAQTILDNPIEWGLCPKNDVAKERTKWIKELQQRGLNHDKAMTDACGQIVDLEDEVSRLREALERIAAVTTKNNTRVTARNIAKEALKQQQ